MTIATGDLRIRESRPLTPPAAMAAPDDGAARSVQSGRESVQQVMDGTDDRLVVIVGPCSIHDPAAALEYAGHLQRLRRELGDDLFILMRVYFEKPRTTVGWKGLINDPHIDGSFDINAGLTKARQLLLDLAALDVPAATEFLDLISPQYLADLVTWGAIGARTTESQGHRELASGLSCPVGFKNGTGGDVQIAVDAIGAAAHPHNFLGVGKDGHSAIVETAGNPYGHVILRGGRQPNYDAASVDDVADSLAEADLPARIMIDASHANSRKKPDRQAEVARDIARQVAGGDHRIFGMMLESHLLEGKQAADDERVYGRSITDACMGWERTEPLLHELAASVRARREA